MKKLSQALVFLLMLDAAWVLIGLKNRWVWIAVYGAILTVKNAVDWFAGRKRNG